MSTEYISAVRDIDPNAKHCCRCGAVLSDHKCLSCGHDECADCDLRAEYDFSNGERGKYYGRVANAMNANILMPLTEFEDLMLRNRMLSDIALSALALKLNIEHGFTPTLHALNRDLSAFQARFGGIDAGRPNTDTTKSADRS